MTDPGDARDPGAGRAPGDPLLAAPCRVLDGFFRHHPDQLYLWRREGDGFVLQDYNEAVERMAGGGMREMVGRDARDIGAAAPEALAAMDRAWVECRVVPVELTWRFRTTGQRRELHVVYIPLPPTHLVSQAVDITGIREDNRGLRERGEALEAHRRRLQALAAHLELAREDERRRLSRELHDELGQRLTVLHLDLQRALSSVDDDSRAELEGVGRGLLEALDVTRKLARRLRPSILDDLGLSPALRVQLDLLRERLGVEVSLEVDEPEPALAPDTATTLFRIAQEAFTNVARHAGASRVRVRFAREGGEVVLAVRDDGRGFDPDPRRHVGLGLVTMQERAAALGGTLTISSGPGEGSLLEVRAPLSTRAPSPHAGDR